MARGSAGLAIGAGAIAAALVLLWLIRGVSDPDLSQAQDQGPAQQAAPVVEAAEATASTAPAEVVLAAPRLDVVRVDAGGLATIAGSAPPEATLSLRLDGVEIGQAKADASGQFATLLTLEPSDAPRLLGVAILLADGGEISGPDLVALAPVVAAVETVAADAAAKGEAATQPVIETPPVLTPPAALLLSPEGVTVLQDGGAAAPAAEIALSIDSISYGAAGEVLLAGKAAAGAPVRIYLDDAAAAEARADAQGIWRATLTDAADGLHLLRADQIAADGTVQARFETPFKRDVAPQPLSILVEVPDAGAEDALAGAASTAAPETPATEPVTPDAPAPDSAPTTAAAPITITVQPGLTLWAIAQENFGDGVMYVQVFEANRDKIKDPDLIYPGQVFTVPKP